MVEGAAFDDCFCCVSCLQTSSFWLRGGEGGCLPEDFDFLEQDEEAQGVDIFSGDFPPLQSREMVYGQHHLGDWAYAYSQKMEVCGILCLPRWLQHAADHFCCQQCYSEGS